MGYGLVDSFISHPISPRCCETESSSQLAPASSCTLRSKITSSSAMRHASRSLTGNTSATGSSRRSRSRWWKPLPLNVARRVRSLELELCLIATAQFDGWLPDIREEFWLFVQLMSQEWITNWFEIDKAFRWEPRYTLTSSFLHRQEPAGGRIRIWFRFYLASGQPVLHGERGYQRMCVAGVEE